MQTQYRTRLLAVATRLRQAPEEAALLKYVDHAGLQRAVDDYCRALEESLPPPLLVEVGRVTALRERRVLKNWILIALWVRAATNTPPPGFSSSQVYGTEFEWGNAPVQQGAEEEK